MQRIEFSRIVVQEVLSKALAYYLVVRFLFIQNSIYTYDEKTIQNV